MAGPMDRPFCAQRSGSRTRRRFLAGGLIKVDRSQDGRSRSLNPSERFGERSGVATIEVDIVACSIGDVEAACVPNHERHGFGFELASVT
jgi:hypothetical protein